MSVQADPYYNYLDDPQTVTVSQTRSGTTLTDSVTKASRLGNKETRNAFGGIALNTNEQGWNIPNALLVNITTGLQPGDTLTHGATIWHIREVDLNDALGQWNLKCEKARD